MTTAAATEPAATEPAGGRDRIRAQIVAVAADLLARGGREAVTTRAVGTAAGVQAPTIYRLFGDKSGLLDAVAEHGFGTYLSDKQADRFEPDPVQALRVGWDLHLGFGLANPALYSLMFGDPRPGTASPAAEASFRVLRSLVRRIAEAGRLRLGQEHAVQLIHASGSGTVLSLLAQPPERRDLSVSTLAREACIATVTADRPTLETPGPVGAAVALRAVLPEVTALTPAERGVLAEWLDRITTGR